MPRTIARPDSFLQRGYVKIRIMRLAVGREAKLQERFLKLQAAKSETGKPAARSSALVARRVRREFRYQCLTNIVMVAATLISTTQMSTASLPSIAVSLPSSSLMSAFVARRLDPMVPLPRRWPRGKDRTFTPSSRGLGE